MPMLELKSIQPSWVGLVEIIQRLEEQPYHPPVGRIIFQKIAYVATQEGLPTELQYHKSKPVGSGLTIDLLR
jgi:hypothetical protein